MTQHKSHHGTCVALDGSGVFITGKPGSGKSALALILMGLGCRLVADDQVILSRHDDTLQATCPPTIANIIEARGIGLIQAVAISSARITLVVDMNETEHERLPNRRNVTLMGCTLPLIRGIDGPHLAAAIVQILKAGWSDR